MLFHISFFHRFIPKNKLRSQIVKWVYIMAKHMKLIAGLDYTLEGEMLDVPAIYASRHESTWETVIFFIIFKCTPIVLKTELTKIPLFGEFLQATDMIPVDRSKGAESLKNLMRCSKKVIENNDNVVIFPEGTRKKPGAFSEINTSGLYAIYKSSGAPVVPVVLNSGYFWKRRAFCKYPGTIIVKFLTPIQPGLNKDEFAATFNKAIHDNLIELYKNTKS